MEELYLEGNRIDLGKARIVRNIQNNDLAGIGTFKADFTNRIKVPKTASNMASFSYLGIVGNTSPYAKQSLKAVLYVDGMNAINRGVAKILKETEDAYEIAIYSGNYSFYDAIKNLSVNDLDLSENDHIFTRDYARGTWSNTDGIIYPVGQFKKASIIDAKDTSGNFTNEFLESALKGVAYIHRYEGNDYAINRPIDNKYGLQLMFFEHTLFDKIIEESGFTCDFDFFDSSEFKNKVVSSDEGMMLSNGASVNVNDHLPDINQWDFVKEIFNRYGIVYKENEYGVSSNSSEREIIFKKTEDILSDTPDDWSEKFISLESTDYSSSFGQNNYFEFKSGNQFDFSFPGNNDKAKTDRYSFYKSIYPEPEVGFLVGSDKIRGFECINERNEGIKVTPHVFSLRKKSRTYGFSNYGIESGIFGYPLFPKFTYQDLTDIVAELTFDDFNLNEIAEDHHKNNISTIRNGLKSEISAKVSVIDLIKSDFLRPKYFSQLGGSFYIDKIKNFQSGKPTKIEVIKIDITEDFDFSNQNPVEINPGISVSTPVSISTNSGISKPLDVAFNISVNTPYMLTDVLILDNSGVDVQDFTFAYYSNFENVAGTLRRSIVQREDLLITVRIKNTGTYNLFIKVRDAAGRESGNAPLTITVN